MKSHKKKNKKSLQQKDLNNPKKVGWTSEDLISEILLRLPEKSVARFRC
ncbi:hypothetical protein CARUB_v100080580mg, partial [Capsella rubella]